MSKRFRNWFCLLTTAPLLSVGAAVDFNREVRPILSDHCGACHGPDEKKRKADVRLDLPSHRLSPSEAARRAGLLAGGAPDRSEFVRRLYSEDPDEVMPPSDSGLALTSGQKELLKRWVAEGASFDEHWAFVVPVASDLPEVKRVDWCRTEIDRFVLSRLEAAGLGPSPEADAATLLRRLSFRLTGLPPTPEEIEAFVRDTSPGAYMAVLGRLLQSKRFGERMAVDWLDAARYADTSGYQYDWPRTMWRWRDWVIDAFNNNLPYSAFLEWQLAGDLLPNATRFHAVATGFNRNHGFTIEGGTLDEEYRVQYVNDRVVTMGAAMLGLTLDCARCHDHKYDPISMRDYYGLFAFFNRLDEKGSVGGKPRHTGPAISTPTGEQLQEIGRLEGELRTLWSRMREPDGEADQAQQVWERGYRSIWSPAKSLQVRIDDEAAAPLDAGNIPLPAGRPIYLWCELTVTQSITGLRCSVRSNPSETVNGGKGVSCYSIDLWRKPAEGVKTRLQAARADSSLPDNRETVWALWDEDGATDWVAPFGCESVATHEFPAPVDLKPGEVLLMRLDVTSPVDSRLDLRLDVTTEDHPVRLDPTGRLEALTRLAPGLRDARGQDDVLIAFRGNHRDPYRETYRRILDLTERRRAEILAVPMTMIMRDEIDRETYMLERGAYDRPGAKVEPSTPAVLSPMPPEAPRNRLGLARWVIAPENPLTARVAVNRIWRQMFGHGLVRTPEDFGAQGEAPTHPELLDWLAVDFVRNGWNVKRLVQQICLSATWRQTSTARSEPDDPGNRLLARYHRQRLPAEMLRDNALTISGLLVEQVGGASVKPYQPEGLWKVLTNREDYRQTYRRDRGTALYRRGLYVYWKRASHHPVMALFDAPSRETCTLRRPTTNTPLQALALLNETAFVESARALAGRMLTDLRFGRTDEERLAHAFLASASRPADKLELFTLKRLLAEERTVFDVRRDEVRRLLAVGDAPNPAGVNEVELAAFTSVARALLNMSDTITLP